MQYYQHGRKSRFRCHLCPERKNERKSINHVYRHATDSASLLLDRNLCSGIDLAMKSRTWPHELQEILLKSISGCTLFEWFLKHQVIDRLCSWSSRKKFRCNVHDGGFFDLRFSRSEPTKSRTEKKKYGIIKKSSKLVKLLIKSVFRGMWA